MHLFVQSLNGQGRGSPKSRAFQISKSESLNSRQVRLCLDRSIFILNLDFLRN
jgi:hypothetical protein